MNRSFYVVGMACSILGSALAFLPFFLDAYGLPKMAFAAIGAMVLSLGLGVDGLSSSALTRPILALAAACGLSWAFSTDPAAAWLGIYSQPFHALSLFAIAVVIFFATRARLDIIWTIPWIAAAGLIVNAVFCGLQLWRPGYFWGEMVSGRTIGTIGNPAFLGGYAAVSAPLAAALIFRRARIAQAAGLLAWGAAVFAIYSSGSRGAILAALGGLWAFAWGFQKLKARSWHGLAVFALLAGLGASGAAIGRAQSDPFRLQTWRVALRAWDAHPLLGWGPEAFPVANRALKSAAHVHAISSDSLIQASAHNDLLQAAATLGLLGLLAWLWLWMELYGIARRAIQLFHSPTMAGAAGALVAVFIQAKLNPITIPTILTAAAAAGMLASGDCAYWKAGRKSFLGWFAVCALALSALWPISRAVVTESLFVAANTFFARGRIIEGAECMRAAQELRPTEKVYAQNRVARIITLIQQSWVRPSKKRQFSALALHVAGRLALSRPNDPESWELLGVAQLIAAQNFKDNSMARASFISWRKAISIDPLVNYSRANSELIARAFGDLKTAKEDAEVRAQIERLIKK